MAKSLFWGWLLSKADPIYVFNKNARFAIINRHKKASPKANVYQVCVDRLKNRKSIGIFPEGTRNKDARTLKRGRLGSRCYGSGHRSCGSSHWHSFPNGVRAGMALAFGNHDPEDWQPLALCRRTCIAREMALRPKPIPSATQEVANPVGRPNNPSRYGRPGQFVRETLPLPGAPGAFSAMWRPRPTNLRRTCPGLSLRS